VSISQKGGKKNWAKLGYGLLEGWWLNTLLKQSWWSWWSWWMFFLRDCGSRPIDSRGRSWWLVFLREGTSKLGLRN